jgi:chemotaxis family two-component system sensor kinase Cph1
MPFKDIVNRDIVNLSNCESEPIHIPGSIQPHGFLIGLRSNDLKIVYCSENCTEFIGISHADMLGKTFGDIFSKPEIEKLLRYLQDRSPDASKPYEMIFEGRAFNIAIHTIGNQISLLEFELLNNDSLSLTDVYDQTLNFVNFLSGSSDLQQLAQRVSDEIRRIIGYDRVMVYRFDKDYNGEIYAESKREDLEPFLGLNYPHTDIPSQARELYMRNLLRLISDVGYRPVPIYRFDDTTEEQLDLSLAGLRSVSPIHVQYLQNMGVAATLTISLIHEQKLWGLIACHHYSPKVVPYYSRLSAQLQGSFLASQIKVREVAQEHTLSIEIEKNLDLLLSRTLITKTGNYQELVTDDALLKITAATGVAMLIGKQMYHLGTLPTETQCRALADWLFDHAPGGHYYTSRLVDVYEPSRDFTAEASGIIYHSLGRSSADCILWFRPEVEKTVQWAGDPNKSIIKDEKGLHPRKSFESWKEIRKFNSLEWREPEIHAASNFSYALQKQTLLLHLTEEEKKYRQLSERLKKTNSELENMNWISTHDLKEPLRKIQLFASMVLEDQSIQIPESVINSIAKMSGSALRMQTLLNDILNYSKLGNKENAFDEVDLNDILQEVKTALKDDIVAHNMQIISGKLPFVKGVRFQLVQLFVNLFSNALKFSKEEIAPEITISCTKISSVRDESEKTNQLFYQISIQDNGIGFDNQFSKSLFDIFKRLHIYEKYRGNGIGLAISRKIMENHNGFIEARGEPQVGATFMLYFPV